MTLPPQNGHSQASIQPGRHPPGLQGTLPRAVLQRSTCRDATQNVLVGGRNFALCLSTSCGPLKALVKPTMPSFEKVLAWGGSHSLGLR